MKRLQKSGRRVLSMLLALVMCLGMLDVTALAAELDDGTDDESLYICGQVEHVHTEDCYNDVPLCGFGTVSEDPDTAEEPDGSDVTDGSEEADAPDEIPDVTGDPDEADAPDEDPEDVPEYEPEDEPDDESDIPEVEDDESGIPEAEDEFEDDTEESEPVAEELGEDLLEVPAAAPGSYDVVTDSPEEHEHTDECYLVCELEEHTHTLTDCTVFPEAQAAMEEFGPKWDAFRTTYRAGLPEESDDWDRTDDYVIAATIELGEEFGALYDLYQQIPSRFADDWDFIVFDDTMKMFIADLQWDPDVDLESRAQALNLTAGTLELSDFTNATDRTVTLTGDVTVSSTIEFTSGNYTLDLNGHKVTFTGGSGSVFIVNGGSFTLNDSPNGELTSPHAITYKDINQVEQTVYISGGVITGGKGSFYADADSNGKNPISISPETSGGGVLIKKGSFTMNGGTIAGNEASRGGGIYAGMNTTLRITNGSVSYNTAEGTFRDGNKSGNFGGGGIWINAMDAVIDPGDSGIVEIKNNISKSTSDLGGGGIYVNNEGKLIAKYAVITGNTAWGLGGGLAACVHGKVALVTDDGSIINDNKANAAVSVSNSATLTSGTFFNDGYRDVGQLVDGQQYWNGERNYPAFKTAAKDIFSAGYRGYNNSGIIVSDKRSDGKSYKWSGIGADTLDDAKLDNHAGFHAVSATKDGYIYGGYLLGLTAGNPDGNPRSAGYVEISGNVSKTHGGGIGTNGRVELGTVPNSRELTGAEVIGDLTLSLSKQLENANLTAGQFQFGLWTTADCSGDAVSTASNDANGNVTLSFASGIDASLLKDGRAEETYTFYVREIIPEDTGSIRYDEAIHTVTVKVVKNDNKTITEQLDSKEGHIIKLTIYRYEPSMITWDSVPYVKTTPPTITNTWGSGKLAIRKTVTGPSDGTTPNFGFNVALSTPGGTTATSFSYTVTAGTATTGSGTIRAEGGKITLAAGETATIEGIPLGTTYTVTEDASDLYSPTITNGSGTITANGATVEASATNERIVTALTIKKTVSWDDGSNDGKHSSKPYEGNDTFTFAVALNCDAELIDTATPIGTTTEENLSIAYTAPGVYVVTVEEDSSATITNVPVGSTYTIKEIDIPDNRFDHVTYKVTGGEGTVTTDGTWIGSGTVSTKASGSGVEVTADNRYFDSVTGSITVTKQWPTNASTLLPDYITVAVYQKASDGTETYMGGGSLIAGTDPAWSLTLDELPLYESEGVAYTYYAKEIEVNYDNTGKDLLKLLNTTPGHEDAKLEVVWDEDSKMHIIYGDQWVEGKTDNKNRWTLGAWMYASSEVTAVNGAVADGDEITLTNTWRAAEDIGTTSFTITKYDGDGIGYELFEAVGGRLDKDNAELTALEDAEFALFKKGTELPDTITDENIEAVRDSAFQTQETRSDGTATFAALPGGEYILREIKAPTGYQLSDTVWEVTVSKTGLESVEELEPVENSEGKVIQWKNTWTWEATSGALKALPIEDARAKAPIGITKLVYLDGIYTNIVNLKHEFKVYAGALYDELDNFGVITPDMEPVAILTFGQDGEMDYVETQPLPWGVYTIVETTPAVPGGYVWQDVEFSGGEDGKSFAFEVNYVGEDGSGKRLKAYQVNIEKDSADVQVTARNSYESSSLTLSKDIIGVPTGQEFGFSIALSFDLDANPELGQIAAIFGAEGMPITVSRNGVSEDDVLYAEDSAPFTYNVVVWLSPDETVTVSNIPIGMKYTVTELEQFVDENGNKVDPLLHWDQAQYPGLRYTPVDPVTGVVVKGINGTVVSIAGVSETYTNELYIPHDVELELYKKVEYDGDEVALGDRTFTFQLSSWEKVDGTWTWSPVRTAANDSEGVISFKLTETKPGTYYYRIAEIGDPKLGYIYADDIYAKVTVKHDGEGVLSSTVEYYDGFENGDVTGNQLAVPTFVNVITDNTMLVLQGEKYLDGRRSAVSFTFTLTDVTNPRRPRVLQTVSNNGGGLIQFRTIRDFPTDEIYQITDASGKVIGYKYVYEIEEVNDRRGGYNMDSTVYTVTVIVSAAAGRMEVESVTYTINGRDLSDTTFSFYNTTDTPDDGPGDGPGDEPGNEPEYENNNENPEEDLNIPENPVPRSSTDPEEPLMDIPDGTVPLAPAEEEPLLEVPEMPVPKVPAAPEEEPLLEVPEMPVPLAGVPHTGDGSGIWSLMSLFSAGGIIGMLIAERKRRKQEEEQEEN